MISKTQILEREKRWSLIAGIVAVGAVAIYFAGQMVGQSGVGVTEGAAEYLSAIPDHKSTVLLGGIMQGIGVCLLAVPLVFLFFAALARSPRMRRGLMAVMIAGPLFVGLGSIASTLISVNAADNWDGENTPAVVSCLEEKQADQASGTTGSDQGSDNKSGEDEALTEDQRTECLDDAANDLRGEQGLSGLAVGLSIAGAIGFLIGLMYTSLNAMRVGLLSRFWGSLGMAVGVLLIFPVLNYIALAWFIYVGLLFAGWIPGGRPKAWEAGEAIPWPVPGQPAEGSDEDVIEGSSDEIGTTSADPGTVQGEIETGETGDPDDGPQGERRKRKKRNS